MAGDVEPTHAMINLSFDITDSGILSERTAGDQSELIIGSPTEPSLTRSSGGSGARGQPDADAFDKLTD